MRTTVLGLTFFAAACAVPVDNPVPVGMEMPAPPPPSDYHVWLQQLVGSWTVTSEAVMGPDTEPMKMQYAARTRSIGEFWIQTASSAKFDGQAFTSLMTLGYDPAQEAFVGTWVDSMQTHMWKYRGTLDNTGKVLTLVTEGPSFEDPNVVVEMHDIIEVKSKDHLVLTSRAQGLDGKWVEFMTANYRRK